MSFINSKTGIGYAPGYFLASADCERQTAKIAANHSQVVTRADGSKYVPAGAVIPSNDAYAKGILYEDVDVSTGAMPGSIVTKGTVYEDRLPAAIESAAEAVLTGIKVIVNEPGITRPDFSGEGELDDITVQSAAGTASGDTALTLSGYTPGSGESYVYKVGNSAPVIGYKQKPDFTWTPWDGSSDITAASNKKIAVVSVDADGKAVAYGSATVTAKS